MGVRDFRIVNDHVACEQKRLELAVLIEHLGQPVSQLLLRLGAGSCPDSEVQRLRRLTLEVLLNLLFSLFLGDYALVLEKLAKLVITT
jgi:hypothetical protein